MKATMLEMIVVESRQNKNSRILSEIARGNPTIIYALIVSQKL